MPKRRLKGLPDNYGPPFGLVILLTLLSMFAKGQNVYNPSYTPLFTVSGKPYAMSQAGPDGGRSYKADSINFIWRPFNGTAEVLTYFPVTIPKYRTGQFPIEVNIGGALQSNGTFIGGQIFEYWWRNGTADSQLVVKAPVNITCTTCLQAPLNLSDLANAATARTNLGLGSMAIQSTTASSTDISGTWPSALTVNSIQGKNIAYLTNYLNLSNTPAIPAQLNPTGIGLVQITGVYPNLTWNGITPTFEQTLLKLNTTSQVDSINIGNFAFRFAGTGGLGFPKGNTSQRPSSPAVGDGFYNTDSLFLEIWNGSAWKGGTGSGGGGGGGITAGVGDVTFSGSGTVTTTLATVNSNIFSLTPVKITVNAKGLITAASALTGSDLNTIYGYTPYNSTNPAGYIPLTALSATTPLQYNNTTGVFTILQSGASQNGYLSSTDWNTFNGKQASGNYITGLTGDVVATGPGSVSATIQANAVTTSKINANAVTLAKLATNTANTLIGFDGSGNPIDVTPGTNINIVAGVISATTAGAQTLTYTQNALNNNLAISGGNSVNFLPATHLLAGLLDTARATFVDSLKNGLKTFTIFTGNYGNVGLGILFSASSDSLIGKRLQGGTGISLTQNNDSSITISSTVTPGINQLTGDVTAGPGSGSQVATIAALAVTTGKIAANAVTLGKMSTGPSNQLIGYDGSGNPISVSIGTGLSLSSGVLSSASTGDVVTTITSGSSSTVPNGTNIIQFNPTSVIANYTLTLPTTWHGSNNLIIAFTANGTITAGNPMVTTLTIVNGAGQTLSQYVVPNTGNAGEIIQYHLIGTVDQRTN